MKCPKCNKEVDASDIYCPNCGSYLNIKDDDNKKNKKDNMLIIFLIITILLCFFGIYKYENRPDLSKHGSLNIGDEVNVDGTSVLLEYVKECDTIYNHYDDCYISEKNTRYIVAFFRVENHSIYTNYIGNWTFSRYLDSYLYEDETINNIACVDGLDSINLMRLDSGYCGYVVSIISVSGRFDDIDYEYDGYIWHIEEDDVSLDDFIPEYEIVQLDKIDNYYVDKKVEAELLDYEVFDDILSLKFRIKNIGTDSFDLKYLMPHIRYYIDGYYINDIGFIKEYNHYFDSENMWDLNDVEINDEYIFHIEVKYKKGIYTFIYENEEDGYMLKYAFEIK